MTSGFVDVGRLQQPDAPLLQHIREHIEVLDADACAAQQHGLELFARELPNVKFRVHDPTHATRRTDAGLARAVVPF